MRTKHRPTKIPATHAVAGIFVGLWEPPQMAIAVSKLGRSVPWRRTRLVVCRAHAARQASVPPGTTEAQNRDRPIANNQAPLDTPVSEIRAGLFAFWVKLHNPIYGRILHDLYGDTAIPSRKN
jgi:hypothetical protein